MKKVTVDQARRIALRAQDFRGDARPTCNPDRRNFRRLLNKLGLLQIDSVNVLSRSHYLPVLSRLGPYERARLDAYTTDGSEVFEFWAHEASLLPVSTYSLWRHRMAEPRRWQLAEKIEAEMPGYVERVYQQVAAAGPLHIADLDERGDRTGDWWGYAPGKVALERLFATGRITGYRDAKFGRVYDLPERALPAELVSAPAVPKPEAFRQLLLMAATHHGIGTVSDLADYYRLHIPTCRPILAAMATAGDLTEVSVPGWRGPVYLHPEATLPRRVDDTALLSPFDPVVWHRDRAERLFDFAYKIEIYVPKPKRKYGYYVLPFMMEGNLVGRVDLKADRKQGRLLAQGSHSEPGTDSTAVASAMLEKLREMARWLGLSDDVEVVKAGNLAESLRKVAR